MTKLVASLALLGALVAAFLVPRHLAVGTVYFSTPHEHSGVGLHVPFQVAGAALWREGVPLWNPWSGCGTPHLANMQSSVFFPLHALFLVLPPITAAEVLLVLRIFLAGASCLLLARALGLTRGAGLFLAVAFAFNAWQVRFANNAYANSYLMLPLTAAAYVRLGESGKRGWLIAALVLNGLHVVSGMPESAAFACGFGSLLFLYTAFLGAGRHAWGSTGRKLGVLAATLAGGALLAAAQVLPFLEYLSVAWSTHLGPVDFTGRHNPPSTAVASAYPFLAGPSSIPSTGLSVGAVVLLFAARGVVRSIRGGLNLFLAAFAVLGALKLLGIQPLHALGRLPLLDTLNFPLYLPPALVLALGTVGAMGFDEWWREREGQGAVFWGVLGSALVAVWFVATGQEDTFRFGPYPVMLLGITLAAVVVAVHRRSVQAPRPAAMAAVVIGLLSLELWLHYSRVPNKIDSFEALYAAALGDEGGPVGDCLAEWMDDDERFRVAGSKLANPGLVWGPAADFDYHDAIGVARYATYRDQTPGLWQYGDAGEASGRLLDLAAVGTVVVAGPTSRSRPTDLMHWLEDKGFREWSGASEPLFTRRDDEPLVEATVPFTGTLRFFGLGEFERIVFRHGLDRPAPAPVTVTLSLVGRGGERALFADTYETGESGWREARVPIPEDAGRAALVFDVAAPAGSNSRLALAELRLARTGQLSDEHLVERCSAPGYTVFENQRAVPRAYVAHRVTAAKPGWALEAMLEPDFVPGRSVALEQPMPLLVDAPPGTASAVRFVHSGARRVELEVETAANGILVLSDTYYPGWTASVDGEDAEIVVANGMFRGVPVGPGTHRVEFRYDPWSFRLGAALSLLTLLGVIVAGVRRRR